MRKLFTVLTLLTIVSLIVFCTMEARDSRLTKAPRFFVEKNGSVKVVKNLQNRTQTIQQANATAIFVANQWNAYSSQGSYSNQLAYDPYSGYIAVVHRTDQTGAGSGFEVYNVSDDGGLNWTPQIGPINPDDFVPAWYNADACRHPSCAIPDPTQSAPIFSAYNNNLASGGFRDVEWSQDVTFDGTVAAGGVDTTSVFGYAIETRLSDGAMFALWGDPGDDFNNLYLAKSTDAGATWSKTKIFDHSEGEGDVGINAGWVSFDNSGYIHVVFEGKMRTAPDTVSYYFRYQSSTDDGATWSTPEYVGSAIAGVHSINYQFDALIDANQTLHIGAVMADTSVSPETAALYDITRTSTGTWAAVKVADVQTESFLLDEPNDLSTLNEVHLAKSTDGQVIALQWIDYAVGAAPTDTLADVFTTAKNASDPNWGAIRNITATPAVNEIMTKTSRYLGSSNSLLLIYTLFGAPGNSLVEAAYYFIADPVVVGVKDDTRTRISECALRQNYPNPFNPSTEIKYYLSSPSLVTLKVYNVIGQEVATLVNTQMTAGEHTAYFNASGLTSGVYLYKIQAGAFSDVKKMVILK